MADSGVLSFFFFRIDSVSKVDISRKERFEGKGGFGDRTVMSCFISFRPYPLGY